MPDPNTKLSGSYTPDQLRACEYIQDLSDGAVGCGDDPVGFLIASHRALRVRLDTARAPLVTAEHEPVDLAMLDAMLRETTPGEWIHGDDWTHPDTEETWTTVAAPDSSVMIADFYAGGKSPMEHTANVRLTVALRNAGPALVSELLRLRAAELE